MKIKFDFWVNVNDTKRPLRKNIFALFGNYLLTYFIAEVVVCCQKDWGENQLVCKSRKNFFSKLQKMLFDLIQFPLKELKYLCNRLDISLISFFDTGERVNRLACGCVAALIGKCPHYCVWQMCLRQTVVFTQRDRHFTISALMQPTVVNTDCCI